MQYHDEFGIFPGEPLRDTFRFRFARSTTSEERAARQSVPVEIDIRFRVFGNEAGVVHEGGVDVGRNIFSTVPRYFGKCREIRFYPGPKTILRLSFPISVVVSQEYLFQVGIERETFLSVGERPDRLGRIWSDSR